MRFERCLSLLSLAIVVSCNADRGVAPPTTPPHHVAASIDLSSTGATQLFSSGANAINDSGVIVGFAKVTELTPVKAAVWRPPSYQLETLPSLSDRGPTSASAIGADGTIAGSGCESEDPTSLCHPVYWRGGHLHRLDGVGTVNAICPCDGHTLVGSVQVNGVEHGALWVDDILIDVGVPTGFTRGELRSISRGNIVGNGFQANALAAFRWSPSSGWVKLQSTIGTVAEDVNKSGTAVGAIGVIWFAGSTVETLLPVNSFPSAINDSGVVAGLFDPTFGAGNPDDYSPGTWTAATGWVEIGRVRKPTIMDINNAGLVVGSSAFQGRAFARLWVP